jgi:hypothetical protein
LTKKKLLGGAALFVLTAAGAAVAWIGPRNVIGMLRYDLRKDGVLKVGDLAPDVELNALDGVRRENLSDHMGDRPLLLIFGSFT